ncbi:hypothetical protein MMC25_001904 [Agyrium rufum]|nr:hypothetical protein [Agyrium rufum]
MPPLLQHMTSTQATIDLIPEDDAPLSLSLSTPLKQIDGPSRVHSPSTAHLDAEEDISPLTAHYPSSIGSKAEEPPPITASPSSAPLIPPPSPGQPPALPNRPTTPPTEASRILKTLNRPNVTNIAKTKGQDARTREQLLEVLRDELEQQEKAVLMSRRQRSNWERFKEKCYEEDEVARMRAETAAQSLRTIGKDSVRLAMDAAEGGGMGSSPKGLKVGGQAPAAAITAATAELAGKNELTFKFPEK